MIKYQRICFGLLVSTSTAIRTSIVSHHIYTLLYCVLIISMYFFIPSVVRYGGLIEKPAGAPNENVKGKERMLIKAIPEHRIEQIK